jgi:hypothetical protein
VQSANRRTSRDARVVRDRRFDVRWHVHGCERDVVHVSIDVDFMRSSADLLVRH